MAESAPAAIPADDPNRKLSVVTTPGQRATFLHHYRGRHRGSP